MDYSQIFSTAISNMEGIKTALFSCLAVASAIPISFLVWRLFRYCTNNVITDLDGNVIDGAYEDEDGIHYDDLVFEDEGDLSDYVHMKENGEL